MVLVVPSNRSRLHLLRSCLPWREETAGPVTNRFAKLAYSAANVQTGSTPTPEAQAELETVILAICAHEADGSVLNGLKVMMVLQVQLMPHR